MIIYVYDIAGENVLFKHKTTFYKHIHDYVSAAKRNSGYWVPNDDYGERFFPWHMRGAVCEEKE